LWELETTMAKKQAGRKEVPAIPEDKVMRHARIELPDEDYQRLKGGADRYHISVSAYIRMAVMERIERDEAKGGKG
jgi:hypothetical protein